MRISFQQFLNGGHSWSEVGHNLARSFLKMGHEVELNSTNEMDKFPADLLPYHRTQLGNNFDMAISYTALHNFPRYLSHAKKNRFGIYNYDSGLNGTIPKDWNKFAHFADCILPSSTYANQIFLNSGIKAEQLTVVPHGVNPDDFKIEPYQFKSRKAFKILNVTGQVHFRKNLAGVLEAYGKAFTKQDDVVLILKIAPKKPVQGFEIDFYRAYAIWEKKYPNHGEVEILPNYIDRIESLYLGADVIFSLSHIECFHFPSLLGMASGKMVISSNGGWGDFMTNETSILIDGKLVRAPKEAQYWHYSPYTSMFEPNIDQAAEKLRWAKDNYNSWLEIHLPNIQKTVADFTWDKAAEKITKLCQ